MELTVLRGVFLTSRVGHFLEVLLRMTGERQSALDLVQESFVRAWQKLSTFRGASAFSTSCRILV